MGGRTDRQMDGWTERLMDGLVDKHGSFYNSDSRLVKEIDLNKKIKFDTN